MDIDSELLITLVEARPVLWDKFLDIYRDRNFTKDGWHEVCIELHPEFESLNRMEQNAYGKQVICKWNNIRDSFSKYKKRVRASKTIGGETKKFKKYVYFDQLKFLNKVFKDLEPVDSIVQNKEPAKLIENIKLEVGDLSTTPVIKTPQKRKICYNPENAELRKETAKRDEPCSKMTFLQSLMPHLQKFDDDEFLQFQMEALKVIGVINGKRKAMFYNLPPPQLSQHHLPSYHQPHSSESQYQYPCQSVIVNNPATDLTFSSEDSEPPSPESNYF